MINWINGRKTTISAMLTLTVAFLINKGVLDQDTGEFALGMCALLLTLSAGHKEVKRHKENKENKASADA